MTPLANVECVNTECNQYGVVKHIRLQNLGQGILLGGLMVCAKCSNEVVQGGYDNSENIRQSHLR